MQTGFQSPGSRRGSKELGEGGFLPSPALGCFSIYLSETGVDSNEVGHGCTVERQMQSLTPNPPQDFHL